MEPTGSEKVLNKMNIAVSLLILSWFWFWFCELLMYRSSSTVFGERSEPAACRLDFHIFSL